MSADMDFEKTATRVSLVSIAGNAVLSLFKLLAGVLAHSGAMISDAVHSASDVLSSIIVIIGVKLSVRAPDKEHPYGHERFECVAAIVLAVVLAVTGLMIGYKAVGSIDASGGTPVVPGLLALVAAVVSIVVKEAMSSVGALIGIAGARMGHPVMEPIASLVICVFILKAAYDIFRDAMRKMVDRAADAETEKRLMDCVLAQKEVLGVDHMQTREFGNRIYVDLEIRLDGALSLYEAHEIAEQVHDRIERDFPSVKHIMVHVNPCEKQ